ncbi:MAG: ABC transporter permease [Candidatus Cloacimonetes bacterium]|nr:ABC transporter permease [Candidatus Cloacimonadota bacterium]
MQISENISSSFQSILSHKVRSLLTLLGLIIGVFAVVTMFSSIYGLKNLIKDRMEGMGWNNSIIVYPSSGEQIAPSLRRSRRFHYMRREAKPLTFSDYEMLKKEVETKYIYGMVENWDKYIREQSDDYVMIRATNRDYFLSQTYPIKQGRYFNSFENSTAAKVCVVGYYFAERYFPDNDAIGKMIKIGSNRFRIIGVLDFDQLNTNGMNFNPWERRRSLEAVYIPLSTGSKYLRSANSIDYIYLQAQGDDSFRKMKNETYQNLLAQHKMSHDFSFNEVGALIFQITKELNEMMKKWNITLSAIASISLIVGGIGLFSTLLISINERMMEIGIRKSIGATQLQIFLLFMLEAIILALIGASIGILLSSSLVKVIAMALKADFPVPIQGIMLGIGFSVFIGILSGLYPALKAARLDPIKAIYYFE